MNSRCLGFILVIGISFMFSSCATIIHGSHAKIAVNSNPQGAKVKVNGADAHVTTPGHINVRRRFKPHTVEFEKPGFIPQTLTLHPHFNWLVALDFFMYIIPGVIDLSVGANHDYDRRITANLTPLQHEPAPAFVERPITVAKPVAGSDYVFKRLSDVDIDVPHFENLNPNRYALIIGNEDYSSFQKDLTSESDVAFARNDASAFYEYAQKMLGIPDRNITLSLDATSATMRQGLIKMNMIAKNTNGNAEFFVFYAGHGLPDEETKEPYLVPVDVNGKYVKLGVSLTEFYQQLAEYPTKRTTIFLDACFSGGARNVGLYVSRGIRVTPKNESLKGNMVVFTASSGEESALPYMQKHHGLFTYYLLQKFKDTNGSLSYKELSDFMTQNVILESVLVNNKEQHPKTNISADVVDTWESWTLR